MFNSWKTTLAGFIVFISAAGYELMTLLDTDPLTNPDWKVVMGALVVFLGLASARDNDKTSESAGAK